MNTERPRPGTVSEPALCVEVQFADRPSWLPLARAKKHIKYRRGDPNHPGECVIDCPYCGCEHYHGWGSGPRAKHCATSHDGHCGDYYVACDESLPITFVK